MSADNKKLRAFISQQLSPEAAKQYQAQMKQMDEGSSADAPSQNGMVMKKETVADQAGAVTRSFNGLWIVAGGSCPLHRAPRPPAYQAPP